MTAMRLDPATYTCQQHQLDLTDQVQEAVQDDDDEPPPITYKRLPLLGRSAPAPREFEVIVTCPGTGEAHSLTCKGTCSR